MRWGDSIWHGGRERATSATDASVPDAGPLIPTLLVGVLSLADLLLGRANISGTFALASFLASALTTARWTAVVGIFATASATVLSLYDGADIGPAAVRITSVACGSILSVWVANRRNVRERQLEDMIRVADVAQRAILAPVPAVSGAFAFASAYVSASRQAAIGGDLLDVVPRDTGEIRLVVGDVRGKGLGAVRLSAMMLAGFREMALTLPNLEDIPMLLEKRLAPHLGPEDFVTAVLAELCPDGKLVLINCAHPSPLLLRSGSSELLHPPEPTTPFGLAPEPVPLVVTLQPGDRLLFYTDGLVEARSPGAGEFLALDALTAGVADGKFDGAVEGVLARLRADVGGQLHDDLALLLTEFRGQEAGAVTTERSMVVERLEINIRDDAGAERSSSPGLV